MSGEKFDWKEPIKQSTQLTGWFIDLITGDDQQHSPTFYAWLKTKGKWLWYIFLGCTFLTITRLSLAIPALEIDTKLTPGALKFIDAKNWLYLEKALITFFVFFFVITQQQIPHKTLPPTSQPNSDTTQDALTRGQQACDRLLNYWPYLWAAWILLYLSLAAGAILEITTPYASAGFNFLNNVTALVILSIYNELTYETKTAQQPKNLWLFLLMGSLFVALAELICIKLLPGNENTVTKMFQLGSGLIAGSTTGLLATRLASKSIDVPIGIVSILIIYAIIQPVFPLIPPSSHPGDDDYVLSIIFLIFALYAKLFLVGCIHWLKDTYRLTYYMIRTLDIDRTEFLKRSAFVATFNKTGDSQPPYDPNRNAPHIREVGGPKGDVRQTGRISQ